MSAAATARTIARILKVNHAGEYGAIRIYRAQRLVAGWWLKDLEPFLAETLSHEITHCRRFLEAMPERRTRPCAAMPLWGLGGFALGLLTGLMGRNAVMVCTRAVEQAVHRHLDDQQHFLAGLDEPLRRMIADIQVEENQHLTYAAARVRPAWYNGLLEAVIVASTEAVIWLSTQGAVSRMEKAIRRS